jgi:hypothetical protein
LLHSFTPAALQLLPCNHQFADQLALVSGSDIRFPWGVISFAFQGKRGDGGRFQNQNTSENALAFPL